ncbi:hypothetical protein VT85_00710 [Planctomyces sp. SH-PL62]|nr:hypothetical protein VT85_00710 [Planctomyces sp. SH-PL62]
MLVSDSGIGFERRFFIASGIDPPQPIALLDRSEAQPAILTMRPPDRLRSRAIARRKARAILPSPVVGGGGRKPMRGTIIADQPKRCRPSGWPPLIRSCFDESSLASGLGRHGSVIEAIWSHPPLHGYLLPRGGEGMIATVPRRRGRTQESTAPVLVTASAKEEGLRGGRVGGRGNEWIEASPEADIRRWCRRVRRVPSAASAVNPRSRRPCRPGLGMVRRLRRVRPPTPGAPREFSLGVARGSRGGRDKGRSCAPGNRAKAYPPIVADMVWSVETHFDVDRTSRRTSRAGRGGVHHHDPDG